ncbi:MAG: ShlB/FhaC/HecB family hemolysin secretion/activation protein [Candidatus Parabeggiatoa sp. nov. 1]|nr:MAG: ShlB/FhaC/HecB family hemolysin secretion/activation protein [Gammaproteobacteria bacterium]
MVCFSMTLLLALLNQPLLAFDTPGREHQPFERPSFQPLEENKPALELPPLPELPPIPQDDTSISSVARIKVKQFKFEGNHVFSNEELATMTQDYQNRELSPEQLQEVKNQITSRYNEAGYINSGAIILDQPVSDGIVTITIIEGELFQIDISGNKRLRTSYIEKRVRGAGAAALNINQLQERLQLLQQRPMVERIHAELKPGVKLGEAILDLGVSEASPYRLQFNFNNHRSPSIGAYRGEIEAWHHNLSEWLPGKGWGDMLYLRFGLTEGLKDYTMRYELPLNRYDTTLTFDLERSDSDVVEYPFSELDVESEANTYAITLTHPVQYFKRPDQSLDLALRLEKRDSKTFLLGRPFSFSPGVQEGESHLSVIRFSQQWLKRSYNQVFAARSSFNFGIDALSSTVNDDGSPDSEFFTWLGQFQYVRRLDDYFDFEPIKMSQIIFRTDVQWAEQDLLPLEKLSIGGVSTVRGYRENLLTRDSGFISSLEWRIPVMKWRFLSKEPEDGQVEIMPFIDYGRSWNADSGTPEPKDITSIGLGFNWRPNPNMNAQVYWGYALRDIPDPDDKDLQDDGVHFEFSVWFP